MFTVMIHRLSGSSEEFQQMIRKINTEAKELEDIIDSLRKLSAYEDIIQTMRGQLEKLQEEKQRMMDMMAALNMIKKLYDQTEQGITEFGDGVDVKGQYHSMSEISLGTVQSHIKEYHIA